MKDIESIKAATASLLREGEDLSYIDADLLEQYSNNAKSVDTQSGGADGEKTSTRWGTYGNTITHDPGSGGNTYWKQNKKGTANYGCGTDESWNAGKSWASVIKYQGKCSDGKSWYFIGNYQP